MTRSLSLAILFTTLVLLDGCWTGADSEGLACANNSHCGVGLDCINGYCGGEPSDELCGNGYIDPGEDCDDGEQNADDAACRLDCTSSGCGDGIQGPGEACDLGDQNDDHGTCKTDCTPETCGDDLVGPTEPCDDGNNDPGDGCSPDCKLETCGNGQLEPGEDCDDAGESATCDDDCTAVVCGDTNVNEAAGEACDNDAPASSDAACMDNCTVPLLWDDMEPDTPDVAWSHTVLSGGPIVADTWSVSPRRPYPDSMRSWDSGLPGAGAGDTRLSSPALDLGPLVGESIQLRFDHLRVFSDCMSPLVPAEGALVEVSVDGGAWEIITPKDGYTGPVGDGLCHDNPLDGIDAFILDANYTTEVFDLSSYAGSSIEIGFRVGWDCGNCPIDQSERGWFIDNIVVSY